MIGGDNSNFIRIVILDISNVLCTKIEDEVVIPIEKANSYIEKYIDITKYRVVTI